MGDDSKSIYKAHLALLYKCIKEAMEREDRYVIMTLGSNGYLSVSVYPIDWMDDEELGEGEE